MNLSEKDLRITSPHLYKVECALEGLSALMRQAQNAGSLDGDEMNGVGEIVMLIRDEVLKVKQVLDNPKLVSELERFSSKSGFQAVGTDKETESLSSS